MWQVRGQVVLAYLKKKKKQGLFAAPHHIVLHIKRKWKSRS